jgi:hypothetical protein
VTLKKKNAPITATTATTPPPMIAFRWRSKNDGW